MAFYLNSVDQVPSDIHWMHFYYNCFGYSTCGESAYTIGTVIRENQDLYARYVAPWGETPQQGLIRFQGNGYAILKACIYDNKMNEICDVMSVPITVQ